MGTSAMSSHAEPVVTLTKKRKIIESEQTRGDNLRLNTINVFSRMASTLDLAHAALTTTSGNESETTRSSEATTLIAQLAAVIRAIHTGNVNDVIDKLEQLIFIYSSIVTTEDLAAIRTLQQATGCVLKRATAKLESNSKSQTISPTAPPTKRVKPTLQLHIEHQEASHVEETTNAEKKPEPRTSLHEAEAAQALTVLRSSSTSPTDKHTHQDAPSKVAPSPLPSISVPPIGPVINPSYSFVTPTSISSSTLPNLSPNPSPTAPSLSIIAPRHSMNLTFNAQNNGYCMTSPQGNRTPGSLPSLFSRGLLTPIITSTSNHTGYDSTGSPWGTSSLPSLTKSTSNSISYPYVDWKNLPVPPHPTSSRNAHNGMGSVSAGDENSQPNKSRTPTYSHSSPVNQESTKAKVLPSITPSSGVASNDQIAKSLAALERTHVVRKANPRRWTKEEDDALRKAVENHKEKNWKAIASQVPGRNHTQCLQRWTKVLAPGLVKGHWSPHEDELLKHLVAGGNKNWGEVAGKIPGRTSKQCRERWHNHLDPQIVRTAYSPEEDRMILEAQARLGNRWSVIAAMLPGRTEDAVKIRWKSHCRVWKARKYLRKPLSNNESEPIGNESPVIEAADLSSEKEEERKDMEGEELEGTDSEADASSVKTT